MSGGIKAEEDFVADWEGSLLARINSTGFVLIYMDFIHKLRTGADEIEFTSTRQITKAVTSGISTSIILPSFNSRSQVSLGSATVGGTTFTITQADLDNDLKIKCDMRMFFYDTAPARAEATLTSLLAIQAGVTFYHL